MNTSHQSIIIFSLIILLALNLIVWFFIISENKLVKMDFLDVGQGDATLLNFPNSGKFLIDAGPGRSILNQLGKIYHFLLIDRRNRGRPIFLFDSDFPQDDRPSQYKLIERSLVEFFWLLTQELSHHENLED